MVLKITDKVKFLLRILSCITVCTLTIIIGIQGGEPVMCLELHYMGGGAGRAWSMVYITYFGAAWPPSITATRG